MLVTAQVPKPSNTPPQDAEAGIISDTLHNLLNAIETMQNEYFEVFTGTWPTTIDWTAAVMGTHLSATLSTIASSTDYPPLACAEIMTWENILDRYFAHTSIFYFGENAFALRNQAFDDMLWVVLSWLENIKFMNLRQEAFRDLANTGATSDWHGMQFSKSAAHRARIFYDLASTGWDTSLCGGGMIWNQHLTPYKNAITNELFISASIAMYMYFPSDDNESPYVADSSSTKHHGPHNPKHLRNAIRAYEWLQSANMQNANGLFADGYHITGWRRLRNGTVIPGTGNCDALNRMTYTYNQGVVLTANRDLWIATGNTSYLSEGHELVRNVIKATGWLEDGGVWHGLGRDGVLEEYCDHTGQCSQDGQTFKGIFFHHLAEFCRPLWGKEEAFMQAHRKPDLDYDTWRQHQLRCAGYGMWITRNAQAALATKDEEGRFGMWWGRQYPDVKGVDFQLPDLQADECDYRNPAGGCQYNETWYPEPHSSSASDDELSPVARQRYSRENGDVNDRGRGRTVETQSGGLAVLRALWQWESVYGR